MSCPVASAVEIDFVPLDEMRPLEQASAPQLCPELFYTPPPTPQEADLILGQGGEHTLSNNALIHLLKMKGASQFELAITWERFALIIAMLSTDGWNCTRITGPNGEIGYQGSGTHALLITRDGKILKGQIDYRDYGPGNVWNGIGNFKQLN